ncbi:hypothetical protein [Saccharopolyspora cebuensis]|uniref:hypothetical protein n=1 Tax=Saccharopolyspora cebuensis TaxID=418759 RepID=UPI0031F14BB1
MSDKTGIDYWLESDMWEDTQYADWNKIDSFVEEGLLTEEERDLIQARGSAAAAGHADSPDETDDSWSKYLDLKEEYKDDPRFGDNGTAEDLPKPEGEGEGPNEDTDYVDQSGLDYPGEKPPQVGDGPKPPNYGGEEGDGQQVVVSTEAIRRFIATVGELRGMLDPAKGYVGDIDVKPGAFGAAYALRDRVMGQGKDSVGLQPTILSFLEDITVGMDHLEDDLAKVLKNYEDAEELNKANAADVEGLMVNSTARLGGSPGA